MLGVSLAGDADDDPEERENRVTGGLKLRRSRPSASTTPAQKRETWVHVRDRTVANGFDSHGAGGGRRAGSPSHSAKTGFQHGTSSAPNVAQKVPVTFDEETGELMA